MARILIVEDEESSARALQYFLEEEGYEIACASHAAEAIETAETFRPDLLLTDIFLADQVGGLHVAETLAERDPRLQVVLMTGLPEYDIRERAAHLKPYRLCLKPLRLGQVAETIQEALAEQD